jgi:hypothetical protein
MTRQHPNVTVAHRQLTAEERQMLEQRAFAQVGIVLPDGNASRIGDVGGSGR